MDNVPVQKCNRLPLSLKYRIIIVLCNINLIKGKYISIRYISHKVLMNYCKYFQHCPLSSDIVLQQFYEHTYIFKRREELRTCIKGIVLVTVPYYGSSF